METQAVENNNTNRLSAIELALAAAKARKAAKEQNSSPDTPKKDRAEVKAQIEADRAARRLRKESESNALSTAREEKAAARAAKKAAKAAEEANKRPAHMKKVERAKSKLSPLSSEGTQLMNSALSSLPPVQLEILAQHLIVQARELRTINATNSSPIPEGTTVRITGGDPKYIGSTGTIVQSHKLRLLVSVEGARKPVYIYTGEAEPV